MSPALGEVARFIGSELGRWPSGALLVSTAESGMALVPGPLRGLMGALLAPPASRMRAPGRKKAHARAPTPAPAPAPACAEAETSPIPEKLEHGDDVAAWGESSKAPMRERAEPAIQLADIEFPESPPVCARAELAASKSGPKPVQLRFVERRSPSTTQATAAKEPRTETGGRLLLEVRAEPGRSRDAMTIAHVSGDSRLLLRLKSSGAVIEPRHKQD